MRVLAFATALLLSGCAMFSSAEDFACPKVGLIPDADRVSLPEAEAAIEGFTGTCSFDKEGAVEIDLSLPFAAQRSEGARAAGVELPYFVAVLSPAEEVLQRQDFTAALSFEDDGSAALTEEQSVRIPLSAPATAYQYKVVMGFSLTPEQLQHNRESK